MKKPQCYLSVLFRSGLCVLAFFTYISLLAQDQQNSKPLKQHSASELQEDFDQLVMLMQQHPAFYGFTPEKEFQEFIRKQKKRINRTMTVPAFFNLCAPVIDKIKCVHSWITLPSHFLDSNNVSVFPIRVLLVNDSLVVIQSDSVNGVQKGEVVLVINGKSFGDIVQGLKQLVPSDGLGATSKTAILNEDLAIYLSTYFGFPASYVLQHQSKRTAINAIEFNSFRYPPYPPKSFWNDPLYFEVDQKKHVALMGVKSFMFYNDTAKFHHFADSCFGIVHDQNIPSLILDLRGNGGGDPYCASYLLSYLEDKPFTYYAESYEWYPTLSVPISPKQKGFRGRLFVLIDGRCTSSTGHLVALLKYHHIGTLVGEETGGTYTCNANTKWHTLNHTHLKVMMARQSFRVATYGLAKDRGIMPDCPVHPNIKQVLSGRDLVLENTFGLIEKLGSGE
jgi:hypothetical protein